MVVIAGWIIYLNLSLTPSVLPAQETAKDKGGFFKTLEKGFGVLGSSLSNEWNSLRTWGDSLWGKLDARLANPSVFTFVREESPFVPSPYEPLPPASLPTTE